MGVTRKVEVADLHEIARSFGTTVPTVVFQINDAYKAYSDDLAKLESEIAKRKLDRWLTGEDLRGYDPERHDPDSVFFDDSYTGPSERELSGGCNRCGGFDDCYCDG